MQINIEKKHFYGILGFIILITSGIIIYASVDTSQAWHDANQVLLSSGESLQQAIDSGTIGGAGDLANYVTLNWLQNNSNEIYTKVCPQGNCDITENQGLASGGIGATNIYAGTGGEIDIKDQINFNNNRIKGVPNPSSGGDAVNKNYVDSKSISVTNCHWTDWDFYCSGSFNKALTRDITCNSNEAITAIQTEWIFSSYNDDRRTYKCAQSKDPNYNYDSTRQFSGPTHRYK